MSVGVSTVIGTLGFSDMYSTNKHHATSVEIPNGIYVGGDVAIGGGEVIGIDSWVAGGVSRKKTANS
ncbi:hypothetical protein [Nostoc sp. DSM 114161]|uniref:hypothetical protein n=1 Tax=Nostoc sp. DSM 114161 TaxID=3440143 RepID=UPI00404577FF